MSVSTLHWVRQGLAREVVVGRRAVSAIAVGAMVACLAMAAYARIPLPFTPVPITLQTFFVLIAGAALGKRLGTLSTSLYLLLGTLGLPIFTGIWLGATTGYLVGFAAAGWLIAAIVSRVRRASTARIVLAMLAGTLVIYLFGAGWLAFGMGLGVEKAIVVGVLPFAVGDALKLAAAAAFVRVGHERLRALFPGSR
ncbi:biotin transporter BioY [Planctomycetota bacterium]